MLKCFNACITKHFSQHSLCNRYTIISEKKESLDIVDTIYNEFYEQ